MFKHYVLIIVLLASHAFDGWGQTVIAQQDFETTPATPTLSYTNTNGGFSAGNNGSGLPANANLFVSGSRGWQAVGTTSTLIFANTDLSSYVSKYLTFRLAGMSVNSTNGIDAGDIVTISISTDGGTSYSSELTISGSAANQRWDFSATGTSTITYDGNNSPTAQTSSSGSGGISTVKINLPDAMTHVTVKIALFNDVTNERWVIDDVKLMGVSEPTISATSIYFGSITTSNLTINWTNGNGSRRAVFVKEGSGSITDPVDGTTYTASSDWNSKGTQLGTSGYYCVYDGTGSTVSLSNLVASTTYFVYIYEYNGTGTSVNYRTTDPATSSTSTSSPSGDTDSDILGPVSQVTSFNISSLTDTDGEAVEVFKFRIQDKGTTDALATKVTNIKLIPGGNNSASWGTVIQGVKVKKDGNSVTTGTVSITNSAINIPITSGNLDISSNSSSEITVSIYLKNSGITDNQILSLTIPTTGHGFTTDGAGSSIATTVTGSSSNDHTIAVSASKLNFSSYPSTVSLNTNFTVDVEGTDANGNRDLDAANSVTLARSGGSGTLSSATSLTKSLSSGIATWNDLQYNTQQQFEISASASGLTTAYAPNITFTTPVNASDLFISEYVEGTSNNKYLEIFNGTGATVDLSNYKLRLFTNGSATPSSDITLSGNLSNNSTIVYKDAAATVYGGTATTNAACGFNGDDAVALYKISTSLYVDIFGIIGSDPGSAWTSGSHSTADKTLRRKSAVSQGVSSNPASGFPTLETEWDVYNTDVVSGLGSHTYSASSVIGEETIASGAATYQFTDRHLTLDFVSAGTGGTLNVAFYSGSPSNVNGSITNNISQYRWVITNNGVGSFTVTFRIPRSEFLGITSTGNNVVKLYKRSTPGTGDFTDLGYMLYDGVNDEFYKTGITSFSEFALGSEEPLPVELTSFTARAQGTTVNLMWETKTEIDNNGFEVERNTGDSWQKIGFVEGHGTTNSPKYYNFTDKNVTGNKIQYRLRQVDNAGTFEYSPVVEVELNPVQFALYQNYPNPFNPATVIRYALPAAGVVTIDVFNALGEKVATLLNGQVEAGYHEVSFDAATLPSGLYFYKISSGHFTSVKKMLLMK